MESNSQSKSIPSLERKSDTHLDAIKARLGFRKSGAASRNGQDESTSKFDVDPMYGVNDWTAPHIDEAIKVQKIESLGDVEKLEDSNSGFEVIESSDTIKAGGTDTLGVTVEDDLVEIIPASEAKSIPETGFNEYEVGAKNDSVIFGDESYAAAIASISIGSGVKVPLGAENLSIGKGDSNLAPVSGIRKFLRSLWSPIDTWVNSAAGYDDGILATHGTPTDEKRRRNIGRAIVVATLVGSLGWLVKISLSMPMPWGILVGVTISLLYGVLSYSLESFFASNVNPFAPLWSKLLSLSGRAALSGLIAFSAALPWVIMSLNGSIQLEMVKITQQEQIAMREGIEKINGVTALAARGNALQSELTLWNQALETLPGPIQSLLDSSQQCEARLQELVIETPRKTAAFNARLSLLVRLEANAKDSPQRLKAVADERRLLGRQASEVNKLLADKKLECADLRKKADTARDEHLKVAGEQRQSAQMRLAQQRDVEQAAFNQARKDTNQADELTKAALSANSAGEFTALVSLLRTQLYAQFIAGLIFMGLFLVDLLPLTLRMFVRPGPYDYAKRTDEAARMMSYDGRLMQLELVHLACTNELRDKGFKEQIQREVRPQIRAVVLDDVGRISVNQGA